MNTRKVATECRKKYWIGVFQERSASGMSIRAFCERAGLREHVYFYWQRRLREAACESLVVSARNEDVEASSALVPEGWAVCKPEDSGNIEKGLILEVGGCLVHVAPETDLTLLAKVCRVLASPC